MRSSSPCLPALLALLACGLSLSASAAVAALSLKEAAIAVFTNTDVNQDCRITLDEYVSYVETKFLEPLLSEACSGGSVSAPSDATLLLRLELATRLFNGRTNQRNASYLTPTQFDYTLRNYRCKPSTAPSPVDPRPLGGDGFVAGGTEPADISDESIRTATKFAVDHLNSDAGAELRASLSLPAGELSLVVLKAARKQVVSGLKYYLDEIDVTVGGSAAPVTISAVVWYQEWMPTKYALLEVAVVATEPVSDQPMVGGLATADPADQDVKAAAQFAIEQLNSDAGAVFRAPMGLPAGALVLLELKSARQQIVAGTRYYLDELVVADSGDETTQMTISAVVLWQEWMPEKYTLVQVAMVAYGGARK